jgi:hypothetical protein
VAVTHHDYVELRAGDDWIIQATLLNPDGSAYDLTNATVEWILLGPDGMTAIDQGWTFQVAEPATGGQGVVLVDNKLTAPLAPGYYMDALRAITPTPTDPNLQVTTMWDGQIGVCINMFFGLQVMPVGTSVTGDDAAAIPPPPLPQVVYPDALTSMALGGPALPPSAGPPSGPARSSPVPPEMVPTRVGSVVDPGLEPGPVGGGMVGYD